MRVFLNGGHAPNGNPDPGACGFGLKESDVAASIVNLLGGYLTGAGVEVAGNLQSDSLTQIVNAANASNADYFISVHCNSANNPNARGTEVLLYGLGGEAENLATCIRNQLVDSLGLVARDHKERPGLRVLNGTNMPAVLVETAFISNAEDNAILRNKQDEIARAIARGVTDYISSGTAPATTLEATGMARFFSPEEMMCHGASQGHCNCGIESAAKVSPRLLQLLDKLRENIGGPLEVSCMYRCPDHNAALDGSVPNSQHVQGTAADVQTPNYPHCHTPEQLAWYCRQLPFDGLGVYDWGCHVDVRNGGVAAGIEW